VHSVDVRHLGQHQALHIKKLHNRKRVATSLAKRPSEFRQKRRNYKHKIIIYTIRSKHPHLHRRQQHALKVPNFQLSSTSDLKYLTLAAREECRLVVKFSRYADSIVSEAFFGIKKLDTSAWYYDTRQVEFYILKNVLPKYGDIFSKDYYGILKAWLFLLTRYH